MPRLFLQQGTYNLLLKKSGRYGTLELINRVHPVLPIGLCCSRVACALARGPRAPAKVQLNQNKNWTEQHSQNRWITYGDIYIYTYFVEPNDTE